MFDTEDAPAAQEAQHPAPAAAQAAAPPAAKPRRGSSRKRLFLMLGGAIVVGAVGYGAWWFLAGSRHVTTDNAYVEASTAQITPLVAAPILQVPVIDTQRVKAGDVLVVLDDSDAKLALAQAEAQLAQAESRVKGYYANDDALRAQTAARAAQVASARSDLAKAQAEYDRRKGLAQSGAVSGEELTTAETGLRAAQAALIAAEAQVKAAEGSRDVNAALIAGQNGVAANPEVAQARARVDQAKLDLERTVIRAPIDGVIANNNAQVGQRVQVGSPLMAVVPLELAYVNANFKEVQLRKVRAGQPVELESDVYGKSVKYHGKVVGLAGGTGAAFSLIPAQNATGNWIKVVQRVPVRIALDPAELKAHPLRVGMSMVATVDIG
ncbi:HlyD family efflux transporter periplasmic adaptor subunit [Phenylobacterium sp.]|uniref:HlyD family secretion protein n=1 Tax=Phenylobacterium sp. TaxID=1871053 RepID=UPI0035B09A3B